MRTSVLALSLVAVVTFSACNSSQDMALLHREITDVQRSVDSIQTEVLDKSDLKSMEQSLQSVTDQNMRSNADLATRVEQLQEQIEALHASLEVTTRQLQNISMALAAVRAGSQPVAVLPPVTTMADEEGEAAAIAAGAAAAAAMSGGSATNPEALYRSAYEDYMRGNYDLAADGFAEYLRRYPNTELADNALSWIGECFDAQEKSQEALDTFTLVLEDYPNSDKAAAAQLKKGLIYLKMGDQGQGVVNLQYVVYEHPGTREAELAREQLKSLGLTIR
jgi:tol-pal system protein YbgF